MFYYNRASSGSRWFASYDRVGVGPPRPPNLKVTFEYPRRVSGYVNDGGIGLEGVSISIDYQNRSTLTDPNGYYELIVPTMWEGNITANYGIWVFEPNNIFCGKGLFDKSDQNFTAIPPVKITGYITDHKEDPIEGVLVSANNEGSSSNTDPNGYYETLVPYGWSGTVTPNKTEWGFTPMQRSYDTLVSDQTSQDYSGIQPKISGYVTDRDGAGVEGVLVSADIGGTSSQTDSTGYYEVTVPYGWSGMVTVSKTGWHMNPGSLTYTNVVADQSNQNYNGFQPRISGYVTDRDGVGVEGAVVSVDNGSSVITDTSGFYKITLPYSYSGNVTVTMAGHHISPEIRSYSEITEDIINENYSSYQPRISGYVTGRNDVGLNGVSVVADSVSSGITDVNGYYEII